jgi:hypothetical protein
MDGPVWLAVVATGWAGILLLMLWRGSFRFLLVPPITRRDDPISFWSIFAIIGAVTALLAAVAISS